MRKPISDQNLSREELQALAQAGFERLDSLYALRAFRLWRIAATAGCFARFAAGRVLMLPVLAVVVLVSVAADAYLFALKKVRGSILFPETY